MPSEVNAKLRTCASAHDAHGLHFPVPGDIIEVPLEAP
jgi:hypothetical protein